MPWLVLAARTGPVTARRVQLYEVVNERVLAVAMRHAVAMADGAVEQVLLIDELLADVALDRRGLRGRRGHEVLERSPRVAWFVGVTKGDRAIFVKYCDAGRFCADDSSSIRRLFRVVRRNERRDAAGDARHGLSLSVASVTNEDGEVKVSFDTLMKVESCPMRADLGDFYKIRFLF